MFMHWQFLSFFHRCYAESCQMELWRLAKMMMLSGFFLLLRSLRKSLFAPFRSNLPSHNQGCEECVIAFIVGCSYLLIGYCNLQLFIVLYMFYKQLYIYQISIHWYIFLLINFVFLLYLVCLGLIQRIVADYIAAIESLRKGCKMISNVLLKQWLCRKHQHRICN